MKKFIILGILGLLSGAVMAQSADVETLIIPQGIRLPKDSAVRAGLIGSLRGWLELRDKPDSLNGYVSRAELPETSVFMDELRSIDQSNRRDSISSCRCYLGNVVSLDSMRCLVQLNYLGFGRTRRCCRPAVRCWRGGRGISGSFLRCWSGLRRNGRRGPLGIVCSIIKRI